MQNEKPEIVDKRLEGRILIVDDEEDLVLVLGDTLESRGYQIEVAHSAQSAREKADSFDAQVALLDIRLGRDSGVDLITELTEARPDILCVMMTAYAGVDSAVEAIHKGAYDYLQKPLDMRYLMATLDRCFEKLRLESEKAAAEEALRESEERYRLLAESVTDVIWTMDMNLRPTYFSPSVVGIGYSVEEVAALTMEQFLAPGSLEVAMQSLAEEFADEDAGLMEPFGSRTLELEVNCRDGSTIWTECRMSFLRDAQGQPIGISGVARDITDRKRAQEALRKSEERYRLIAENVTDVIWSSDMNFRFTYVSPSVEHLRGYSAEEVMAQSLPKVLTPASLGRAMKILEEERENIERGKVQPKTVELEFKCKDGSTVQTETSVSILYDENKIPIGMLGSTRDITERKRAEEALRESEERFRSIFENAVMGLYRTTPDGHILMANPALVHMLGYSCFDELAQRNLEEDGFEPEYPRLAFKQRIESEEQVIGLESAWVKEDGTTLFVRENVKAIRDEAGNTLYYEGTVDDITERVQAEESLRQLNQAMEQSPVSVVITDTEGIIQYVNPKFSQVTGYSAEEAIGQNPRLLQSGEHPPAFYRELWDTLTAGQEWQGEFRNKKKNGELFWELASIAGVQDQNGKITHYVAVKEDITQRKQLEEETVRQERLAAVGQLAAGIAHDFNNILTSIIGFADLLQRQPIVSEDIHPDLAKIVEQGQRAAQLTRQILDFSRQTVNEPRPLDLKVYLNETLKFIERTIPETIQIRFNFERGDHTINADPTQMQQVITNLAVNARDAMPGGGTLYLDLSRTNLAPDELSPCPDMETGDWIRLTVTDTGSGIAPEVLPHIFEPFFTTKKVGQGTGLGLAQIYGIVKQHGGCITVNSQVGQGATFTLYFPALTTPAPDGSGAVEAIPKGHSETILLVEDEQVVREVVHAMLERLNYRVLTARDGEEALRVYRAHTKQIALVLTDAVMPKMDGFRLASVLQGEAPGIKVVLMSGYIRDPEIPAEIIQNITARLKKPLSLPQLAEAMREALDDSPEQR